MYRGNRITLHFLEILVIIITIISAMGKILSYHGQITYPQELNESNEANAKLIAVFGMVGMHIFAFIITLVPTLIFYGSGKALTKLDLTKIYVKAGKWIIWGLFLFLLLMVLGDLYHNVQLLIKIGGI